MTSGMKFLATVVIVGICVLAALAIAGNSNSSAAKRAARATEISTQIAEQNTARTECVRAISNELDHARWLLVWKAFNATSADEAHAIGAEGSTLPQPIDVANEGGNILRVHFDKCPPAPLTPKVSS